jgi:DNA-binding transcriptional LysR family regulator
VARTRMRIHAPALQYFDVVRRSASIREGARQLNVASSAVNRQILKLEDEIGAALFERLPSGLRLTLAGEVLAQHVSVVLGDLERATSVVDAIKGLQFGHVELVTLEGLCHRVVRAALAALHGAHPRLSLGVTILETEKIPSALINGDCHLGLAFEVRRRPELRQLAATRVRLGAVVRRDSTLAGKPVVTLRDCTDQPLILPKANFANRDQLHPLFFDARLRERGVFEAGSIELMTQLVLRGLGVAFMTRIGIEASLETGELVHIPLQHQGRPVFSELGLYARTDIALPLAAAAAAEHIADAMAGSTSGAA